MPVVKRIHLHPAQRSIIEHPARFKVAACGRRFGKTMLAGWWLALADEGAAIAGKRAAWFAPTYKLLMDVWDTFERNLKPVIRRSNKLEQRIELTGGGLIDFWTLEDKDAGRGRKYHRIVIDEAAHARYLKDAWEQAISPTLTDYRGQAWFISTPKGLNYFHALYRRGEDPAETDWASFRFPSALNPHLQQEELESRRRDLPALVFAQEYEAAFVTMAGGMVKPEMIQHGKAPEHLQAVLGVDLAISQKAGSDFTAIAVLSREPDTGIVHVREIERGRWSFHEAQTRIRSAAARWKPQIIAIEQTQYQAAMVQELTRTTSLPVRGVRPDRDKVTRFAPLLTRFEQGMVRLDFDAVPAAVRDELLAFPEGEHDDCVDAMSYAFAALSAPRPVVSGDRPNATPWRAAA